MTDTIKTSPKHGTDPGQTKDQHPNQHPEEQKSVSQADGTAADAPAGETQAQPSGTAGDNPATAGPGYNKLKSETAENRDGRINPSAPAEATSPPATTSKMPSNPTRDSAGEVGEPTGKGNMDFPGNASVGENNSASPATEKQADKPETNKKEENAA